jgi:hypothetical protein
MLRNELRAPSFSRSLPSIDPCRHRRASIEVLSALEHADASELEGFSLLEDPAYVESRKLFARAARRLVAGETKCLSEHRRAHRHIGGSTGLADLT